MKLNVSIAGFAAFLVAVNSYADNWSLDSPLAKSQTSAPNVEESVGYKLTRFSSLKEVEPLFHKLRAHSNHAGQCYENAYMDEYELATYHNIQTAKVFLVWGTEYLKVSGFGWWFQTGIITYVGTQPYVLDAYAFDKPMTLIDWARSWINPKFADVEARDCVIGTEELYRSERKKVRASLEPKEALAILASAGGLDLSKKGCTLWIIPQFLTDPEDLQDKFSKNESKTSFDRKTYEFIGKRTSRLDDSGWTRYLP